MKWLKRLKKVQNIKIYLVLLVTIVIFSCGTGLWWYLRNQQDVATPEQRVSEIVENATTADNKRAAQEELKNLAEAEQDTQKKLVYLSGAADLYLSSNDFKKGVEVTRQIESLESTALNAGNLAEAYMQLSDFKNAAKYYGIAASRSEKPARETERAPYNDYMIMKKAAEAKIQ